jgi:hypothetical protein
MLSAIIGARAPDILKSGNSGTAIKKQKRIDDDDEQERTRFLVQYLEIKDFLIEILCGSDHG